MLIPISNLLDLKDGRISELHICTLSNTTASLMGVQTPNVYLKTKQLHHILTRLELKQLCYIPEMIENGLIVREPERPNYFLSIFQGKPYRFKIAIKIAAGGHEIWIATVHRMKPKQTKAILKRSVVIQNHK